MKVRERKTIQINLRVTPEQKQALISVGPKNESYVIRKLIQDHLVGVTKGDLTRGPLTDRLSSN